MLFKIELQGNFSPMDPLEIPNHQISPKTEGRTSSISLSPAYDFVPISIATNCRRASAPRRGQPVPINVAGK